MLEQHWNHSEVGDGLGVGKEDDGGVRLGYGSERFEEETEATDSEKRELGAGVTEAGAESEGDFSIDSLLVERVN